MGLLDRLKDNKRNLKKEELSLRGTGITKRDLERTSERYDREVEKSLSKGADIAEQQTLEKYEHALSETLQALEREARAKNIILDASQLRALHGMLTNQVCCLVGPAGSGKTTLEKILIAELSKRTNVVHVKYEEYDEDGHITEEKETEQVGIAVATFMGRAAQMSMKAIGNTNIPISTMHRMLGYRPVFEEFPEYDPITKQTYFVEKRVFRPSFGINCKLPYTTYIIDEGSTMPVPLFNEFIDAIHPTCRIIVVGDLHQLPPVMSRSVLGYAMQKWPVFALETIHRQSEGNSIIANSQRILKGKEPVKTANFVMIESKAQGATEFATFVRQVSQYLWEKGKFDPYRDQIIVPNSNPEIITSAPALNMHFVPMFNPERKEGSVIVNKRITIHTGTSEVYFAIGDKVMVMQNINTMNPPITNGMMGVVERIAINGKYDQKRSQVDYEDDSGVEVEEFEKITLDLDTIKFELDAQIAAKENAKEKKEKEDRDQRQSSHVMTIKFETGQTLICSTAGEYRRITFGYAITCHKSQGGEYPNVIIAIHSANGALLTQEWLYTAVTRAKENVFLLYNNRGLTRAVKNQKIKGNTLEEKIKCYVIEAKRAAGAEETDEEVKAALAADPWNVDRTKFPILFQPKIME